jgi:hypothetical protein
MRSWDLWEDRELRSVLQPRKHRHGTREHGADGLEVAAQAV